MKTTKIKKGRFFFFDTFAPQMNGDAIKASIKTKK